MAGMTIKDAISWYEAKLTINKEFGLNGPQNDAARVALSALRAQLQEQENKPLTLDELRDMELHQWVWIEVLKPFSCHDKVSAYYKKYHDYTHGKALCCGYPGITFSFDYADYGKTWLAYRRKPESVHNHET